MRNASRLIQATYRDEPLTDYSIDGIASLDEYNISGRELPRFVGIAKRLCGPTVADRSWLIFVDFPAAKSINTGESVAFVAKTRQGWTIWHEWSPIP